MQLGYTILYVDDVGASLDAWVAAFDLSERFRTEDGTYGELDTGATVLSFAEREFGRGHFADPVVRASFDGAPSRFELGFVTADVPAGFARAVAAGMRPIVEPAIRPWGQVVGWVQDANGILVEIASPMEG